MKKNILIQAALLCLPLLTHAAGNDAIQSMTAACMACHGEGGNKPVDSSYPKIGGQHKDYLVKVLRDYRSGKRSNPIMSSQVAGLSQADIDDLAAYFAAQKGDLLVRR